MSDPCVGKVAGATGKSEAESRELLARLDNWANVRADRNGVSYDEALKDIQGQIMKTDATVGKLIERNSLLTIKVKRTIKDFAKRFPTIGEGLQSFLEGSSKVVRGARLSVDAQAKAIHGKYFGSMVDQMDREGVLRDFRRGEHSLDIYKEMEQMSLPNGKPGITGNDKAMKIARIIEPITRDMVDRQNKAGAYINKMPGYIIRQTHDQQAIRRIGGPGNTSATKAQSYQAWSSFVKPLLDPDKTYQGADPEKFLRNIHDALYSGTHGPLQDEGKLQPQFFGQDIGRKISQSRVLHFKDAESAWKYNNEFGIRNFKDQVFSDLHFRSRSIALMENMGPNPELTWAHTIRELREETREGEDAAQQADSLNTWKLKAAFNTVTGANDYPLNFTVGRVMSAVRAMTMMARMGAATITKSMADKAFLQSEMAFQGISNLKTLSAQFTGMLPRDAEGKSMLRRMGAALDGMMGTTAARYTQYNSMAGWTHRAQQQFFDMNFLNFWTDVHKSTAAELMANHLGENAHLSFDKLDPDLQRVLKLYELDGPRWDAVRAGVWDNNGYKYISPDKLPAMDSSEIAKLMEERGVKNTPVNAQRELQSLETALRTYIGDRADIAVPTPGADTKKWMTMDTKAGTPLGEAVRMLTMFKSFPVTVMQRVLARELYANGATGVKQWLLNDHKGKFNMVQLAAMLTAAGYFSNSVKDALKGKKPAPLSGDVLEEAMMRGGAAGMMGDIMFQEYDRSYRSALAELSGPIIGQADPLASMASQAKHGEFDQKEAGKLLLDNTPYINLFYIRPVLDYLVLWNLQEMSSPGSLERQEYRTEQEKGQGYWLRPSEHVRHD